MVCDSWGYQDILLPCKVYLHSYLKGVLRSARGVGRGILLLRKASPPLGLHKVAPLAHMVAQPLRREVPLAHIQGVHVNKVVTLLNV